MPVLSNGGPAALSPTPRTASVRSTRPRPLSMPPQGYNSQAQAQAHGQERDREREREREARHAQSTQRNGDQQQNGSTRHREHRTRPTNRVIGNYTMTKTLGAGTMGKVKLATHNVTGEKACPASSAVYELRCRRCSMLIFYPSSPSRSFPAQAELQTNPTRRQPRFWPSKPRRTHPKKSGRYEKRLSQCSSFIPISVACENSSCSPHTTIWSSNTSMEDRCWTISSVMAGFANASRASLRVKLGVHSNIATKIASCTEVWLLYCIIEP